MQCRSPNRIPHTASATRIIPHNRQSYFGFYFLDEKGAFPPLRGESRVIGGHLQKLQEAREEHVNFTASEEVRTGSGCVWYGMGCVSLLSC